MSQNDPTDPIGAVTHPDPWDYYDRLAARPMSWDDGLSMWIASSAADVARVLEHPATRVRPLQLPVPPHLEGTVAGDVFGRLVRMTDGTRRDEIRRHLDDVLGAVARADVAGAVDAVLARTDEAGLDDLELVGWMTGTVPTLVLARLVGADAATAGRLVDAARTIAAAFAPGPPTTEPASVDVAATTLLDAAARIADGGSGLAAVLLAAIGPAGRDDAVANVAGLFFQNFDATGALIATAIARRVSNDDDDDDGDGGRDTTADARIEEILRRTPPVHNTRRFVHEPAAISGCAVTVEQPILVVLAAAGRLDTASPGTAFGAGAHRCPASDIAPAIAAGAVRWLDAHRPHPAVAVAGLRPSANSRIPTFTLR